MYPKDDTQCTPRQIIERRVVRSLVEEILGHGLLVSVDDGEEQHPITRDRDSILDALINTDQDRVNIYYQESGMTPSAQGSVLLVYGNDGWDVIADYSLSVERFITKTNALAVQLGDEDDQEKVATLIRQGTI